MIGNKALAVFGYLDMHGQNITTSWVKLGATARSGANNITLSSAVDWPVGAEILVTTSGMSPYEGETAIIMDKSEDEMTLVLSKNLEHDHVGKLTFIFHILGWRGT